jgi:hypothetical protein
MMKHEASIRVDREHIILWEGEVAFWVHGEDDQHVRVVLDLEAARKLNHELAEAISEAERQDY